MGRSLGIFFPKHGDTIKKAKNPETHNCYQTNEESPLGYSIIKVAVFVLADICDFLELICPVVWHGEILKWVGRTKIEFRQTSGGTTWIQFVSALQFDHFLTLSLSICFIIQQFCWDKQ